MIIQSEYSIHKFGGSSLADAKKFKALPSLLTGKDEILVVSAIQGTTTALQSMMDHAKTSTSYIPALEALAEKHRVLIKELLPAQRQEVVIEMIDKDILTIKDILYAIHLTHGYSKEIQHIILGYGELWSASILTEFLSQHHKAAFLDAAKVLFIYEKEGIICIDWERSQAALADYLKDIEFDQLVITGFIASTQEGERTTLGRNGSDFSAAIFANLFHARSLTIWTDVNGIYSADPNLVRSAFVIEALSYKDALELAYFGAKVLHPMTIAPVVEQQIPIYIKNSFNPKAKGTCISSSVEKSTHLIKGVSCIESVAMINIEGSGLISVSGIALRVSDILYRAQINVMLISQASSAHSICFAIPSASVKTALKVLKDSLQPDIERKHIAGIQVDPDCAILSAVGDEMIGAIGIAGKFFNALAKANVNIRAISQGSSERNISVVIKKSDVSKALQAVHAGLYLSRKTLSIGLIGPGAVGSALLQQIQHEMDKLGETCQVNLQLRGIMNSHQMLLADTTINLDNWQEAIKQNGMKADIEAFASHIAADNIPHGVIIDCTANKAISQQYQYFLSKGLHVITPNKHANAEDLAYYKKIKEITRNHLYYFYEATVCAGLPVITTLQDLIKTGDEIESVEGVVSGTLSYIFNEMAKGRTFSDVVIEAKARGFTEPDPREDLSGMDVARKIICLAREIGHDVTLDDMSVYNLVPPELASCTVSEFMEKLPQYDHRMNEWLEKAVANHQRLHYVGTISREGKLQVALKLLDSDHPFSRLEGTDNMLIFHTKRYHERPLVIQGPGAGAEVTAAGVFADLLRLVAVLS
jgi:aspartokinase/homoserine dehydrogenase 1